MASTANYHNNQDQRSSSQPNAKKFRLQLSERLHWTAVLAFISYLILLISFASPYWLSSYKFTDSTFKRLGLWDFCFQDYRHPSYQYDTKFTGCHWIYSPVYTNIRDWLSAGLVYVCSSCHDNSVMRFQPWLISCVNYIHAIS
ncbi:hypothetical protein PSTG_20172 [Puccinia striiformis f. sp. tritici PST-78]|uniref:Uncharacterized protein n=1 Tax=Puccinia striiformis f. sp. tritici PST-78 TaxID=1165861 RepID=A0A0L0UHC2_9BASI|nr:hypothetical protein PSTG_20172 [Puccinia striiformis f. sp. tritici PST-78]